MTPSHTDLAHNLEQVKTRMARAAEAAKRDPASVTLIAVTKIFPASAIREAYQLGVREFGENYVQEFEEKFPDVCDLTDARFHLIGHLQSNKARRAGEIFECIQTVDSARLAARLDALGTGHDVMIEVKLAEESAKAGASPDELPELIDAIRSCPHLRLLGLMTMPPWSDNPEESRPYFRKLRALAEFHELADLSMGMSHDLEVAIAEGATYVRVGTALFGKRKKPE